MKATPFIKYYDGTIVYGPEFEIREFGTIKHSFYNITGTIVSSGWIATHEDQSQTIHPWGDLATEFYSPGEYLLTLDCGH